MRDSTLRCWRGVQNPAVLPAPPTTAMSNVSALSALSPSEHVAPEADSLTVDAPSAQPATPDAVTRNDSNETKTGSAQPDTTPSVPEPRSSRQRGTHEARHNREAHRQAQGARPDRVRLTEDADGSPSTPSGDEPATAETSQTEMNSTPTSDSDSAPDSELKDAA